MKRQNAQGILHVPLALTLVVLSAAWLGAWGLLHDWRSQVALQLRLDECVGKTARAMEHALNSIETSNARITSLRAAVVAASLSPEAIPALKLALRAEFLRQELTRKSLDARLTAWASRASCPRRGDLARPINRPHFYRPPADMVGPQALRWGLSAPYIAHVRIARGTRVSSASVYSSTTDERGVHESTSENKWQSSWGKLGAGHP